MSVRNKPLTPHWWPSVRAYHLMNLPPVTPTQTQLFKLGQADRLANKPERFLYNGIYLSGYNTASKAAKNH